jgi:exopolysaccharide biosynthesis polyprenyl glycosylphosphotransferase
VGIVANHPVRGTAPLPVLGAPEDLARVIQEHHVTDVVVGFGGMSSAELVGLLRTCDRAAVQIYMVPRLFEMHHLHVRDDQIWGVPLVRLRRPPQRVATWWLKGAFDKAMAALGLVAALPLLALVALAVRVELGPGVIFRQRRVGLGGREFDLLKFRSMAPTSPTAGTWSVSPQDLGPVGRFIRRYSLDELPQLLNVVRGDMSLVGPRPERPEYVEQFRAAMPPYAHRHRVPVGLTGLAAVNGLRGDTSIQDRVHFDNWYIDNWSLWLDMKILIRTASSVLRGSGG